MNEQWRTSISQIWGLIKMMTMLVMMTLNVFFHLPDVGSIIPKETSCSSTTDFTSLRVPFSRMPNTCMHNVQMIVESRGYKSKVTKRKLHFILDSSLIIALSLLKVWPIFESLLKLLLWNKVVKWIKVLNILPLCVSSVVGCLWWSTSSSLAFLRHTLLKSVFSLKPSFKIQTPVFQLWPYLQLMSSSRKLSIHCFPFWVFPPQQANQTLGSSTQVAGLVSLEMISYSWLLGYS